MSQTVKIIVVVCISIMLSASLVLLNYSALSQEKEANLTHLPAITKEATPSPTSETTPPVAKKAVRPTEKKMQWFVGTARPAQIVRIGY